MPISSPLPASFYDRALAAVGQAVIAADLDGRVLYWNAFAEQLYGYRSAEAVGRTVADLIVPAHDRFDAADRWALLSAGVPFAADREVRDKSGRLFTVYATSTPIVDENGEIVAVLGVSSDVTARRQAEAHARHLAAIVENSADAIMEVDLDGRVRTANRTVTAITGYECEELIGRSPDLLLPPEVRPRFHAALTAVRESRSPVALAIPNVCKDGSLIDISLRLSPVRDETGEIVGISSVARDVTAETRTREELAASERAYRSRFEQALVPQAELSLSGHYLRANDALCRLLGRRRDEIEGAPLHAFHHPSDTGVGDERIAELQRGEVEAASWERVFMASDGSAIPILADAAVLRDGHGTPYGLATFLHDLRELRAAERALTHREALFEALVRRASDVALVVSPDARLTYVSPAATALLGYDPHAMTGRLAWDFVHADDVAEVKRVLHDVAGAGGRSEVLVFRVRHADGTWRWIEDVITNCLHDPNIAGLVSNLRDVTARLEAERSLRESEARYRAIAETAQEGIWTMDTTGRTLYANDKLAAILGVPREEIYRRPVPELVGAANARMIADRIRTRAARGAEEYELSYPHPDGGARMLRVSASPLRDDTGHAGSLAMIADVTGARRAERELQRRALRDELTGLANRALLTDRLDRAVSRSARTGSPLAVMMIDLDQFKLINDTWGHEAGDQLLKRVAERLLAVLGAEDSVARFSGDGFVVVCEDTDQHRAREVADRLVAAFSEPFALDGQRLHVRASVGIAVCPPHSAPDLVRFAEAAMYDAKARGRNRVQLFDGALAMESADRLALSNDLRDALVGDELVLHYQPVIDLATGRVRGVEALARWHHPGRGSVSPARFVAVAEATGLAPALDRWALDRVRRDAAALRAAMPTLHVAVNVSATHLGDTDLEEAVFSALGTGELSARELRLEVTESAMMDNLDQARAALERLKAHGIEVAIDDFGTGYSSLSYLSRLPASTVKIDRSFVEHITEDADARAIVSSVIRLAGRLRLTTVAEGVETPEQLAILRRLGCTAAQGFLFSPAVAVADLPDVVTRLTDERWELGLAG
ncbi:PAS domain S-box protein [Planosporangium thailandense]|uniref:PAS domain S-box protein n=1 Tax=Planosporangium thailandense TaxID=765197 RepID=A0ABX0Y3M4_9ACTN|nr:PAS domain S-box protein [Planosporangium thailandense]NJC72977.1 PAS domain S-box protein [Planosporangium thailandense]